MADIVLTGNTSGAITVAAPAVAGTNTLTLPANTGNIVTTGDSSTITQGMIASGVAGTGPSFSARMTSSQTVPSTTFTKILFNVENWDTDTNYDTTLSRFTPTVAGYYQFNGSAFASSSSGRVFTLLFKNGAVAKYGSNLATTVNGGICTAVNAQLEANGSSDYFECMFYQESGSAQTINADSTLTWFDGFLARAA